MAFCTKCGSQIPDGAAACPSCGQPQNAQQAYQPQQQVPYNAGPSLLTRIYGKPKNTLEKLLVIFSMLFFVLAGLALLIGFIRAIIDSTVTFGGGFDVFLDVFFLAVYHTCIYIFMALALAVFKNRIK